jgi:hypothetical protein
MENLSRLMHVHLLILGLLNHTLSAVCIRLNGVERWWDNLWIMNKKGCSWKLSLYFYDKTTVLDLHEWAEENHESVIYLTTISGNLDCIVSN